ncbi:MAG TPA: carbohydrate ABC transporter permease [Microbacteriaceae bacterium]|nr:carbohydrate ABC transporter permease [Microbacteriaceae bacterium]
MTAERERLAAPRPRRRMRGFNHRTGFGGYAYLILVLLVAAYPLWYAFTISTGDAQTITQRSLWIWPGENFLTNVQRVLTNSAVDFWNALLNSLIVSTTVAFFVVVFSTLAGFAFARLNFRGRRGLLVFVIATMAVPTQLAVVPLYIVMANLQLAGTIWAVIIPALTSAFGVFWMTQYLEQTLPPELIEAARIDGASMIRVFWHVGLPAARPAAAMLALFTFIQTWTNFFWPFIVLDKDSRTLPVALQALANNFFDDYSLIMAGVVLSIIPLLLLFVLAGKQLVEGIMSGAVKG